MVLSSVEIQWIKENEAREPLMQKAQQDRASQSNECFPTTAYYQPSLTEEYDEDSPGGDFDFFSNLVTKWEAAARLPGESTRQVVVRSGEDQEPGNLAKWKISGPRWAEVTVREHHQSS